MKILYKKDSKDKLRIMKVYTDGADLIQESGLADGALTKHIKTCKGKNIGKSNESSPEEQALSEMASKITEKLKGEYFETIDEAMNGEVILPMLAKEYGKEKKKIKWESVYVQPKMDGMRCLIFVDKGNVKLVSRENTDILEQHGNSMRHIAEAFRKLPDGIYDGELYAHGFTFQQNMELIKKYRPGESENIRFHAYDFISELPYKERRRNIIKAAKETSMIVLVPTHAVENEATIMYYHSQFIGEGFEGTIIRHGDGGYDVNKRSSNLLKLKDQMDLVATIIDVIPMEARPKQARLVCVEKGSTKGEFRANLKFSHKDRESVLKEKAKYIGKTAEIRFFEYTDEGLPRHPVCVGLRLDK